MKSLHRPDLFCWSRFDEERNVDFNAYYWRGVLVDPLPLSAHDEKHIEALGGYHTIVITNSDHVRAAGALRRGAKVMAPAAERESFPIAVDRWLGEEEIVPGLRTLVLHGSKTPGELALLLEDTTLITGDLVRAHKANALMVLPAAKLKDAAKARESVQRLAALEAVTAVLVGDGWPYFGETRRALSQASASTEGTPTT